MNVLNNLFNSSTFSLEQLLNSYGKKNSSSSSSSGFEFVFNTYDNIERAVQSYNSLYQQTWSVVDSIINNNNNSARNNTDPVALTTDATTAGITVPSNFNITQTLGQMSDLFGAFLSKNDTAVTGSAENNPDFLQVACCRYC